MSDTKTTDRKSDEQCLPDWHERAEEAARRYNLPMPQDIAPAEVERSLKRFEQQDGE